MGTLLAYLLGISLAPGSSITLNLSNPQYLAGGDVSVNGYVATTNGTILRMVWDWGDGTTNQSWFPALHKYATNSTYAIKVTAFSSAGETRTNWVTAVISNAGDTNTTSIVLSLGAPNSSGCGEISINGFVGTSAGTILKMIWDWGDGSASQSWFPAQHIFSTNGSYVITVTAYASVGLPTTQYKSIVITNLEPACVNLFRVWPSEVFLKNGRTNQLLTVDIRGPEGMLIPQAEARVAFRSSNTNLVQVTADGLVTSLGLGNADITVTLQSPPRSTIVHVTAGEVRVSPSILLLSMDTPTNGQVTVEAFSAAGNLLNPAGHTVSFGGSKAVATVDSTGVVTPLQPPTKFSDSPYITATFDSIPSRNACFLRVTATNLNLEMADFPGEFVTVRTPLQLGPYPFGLLMTNLQVVSVLDAIYRSERRLAGARPHKGGQQYFVLDPGIDADGTVPCGLSGNPVRLGTGVDNLRSCFGGTDWMQWGIFAHELAHDFLYQSSFQDFVNGLTNGVPYVEGLATTLGALSLEEVMTQASRFGLNSNTVSSLHGQFLPLVPDNVRYVHYQALTNYEAAPLYYANFNPDVMDAMLFKLRDQYGPGFFFRLMSVFCPPGEVFLNFQNETQRLTFWVAACSAAAQTDLSERFRDNWGFPFDESYYNTILPQIRQRALQREPVFNSTSLVNGDLRFSAHTVPDTVYRLEESTNLLQWTAVETNLVFEFSQSWTRQINRTNIGGFYRLKY